MEESTVETWEEATGVYTKIQLVHSTSSLVDSKEAVSFYHMHASLPIYSN